MRKQVAAARESRGYGRGFYFVYKLGAVIGRAAGRKGGNGKIAAQYFKFVVAEQAHDFAARFRRPLLETGKEPSAFKRIGTAVHDIAYLHENLFSAFPQAFPVDKSGVKQHVVESLGFSKEENPFELANAIIDRDPARATRLIDKLLESGEEPLFLLNRISGALTKIIKVIRLTAAGVAGPQIAGLAGLNWFERGLTAKARNFPSETALVAALKKVIEAEALLKSSSGTEPSSLLKSIVIMTTGGRRR